MGTGRRFGLTPRAGAGDAILVGAEGGNFSAIPDHSALKSADVRTPEGAFQVCARSRLAIMPGNS